MVKDVIKFNPQLTIAEHLGKSAVALTDKQKLSLYKKSQQSGYPTSILEQVYNRGIISWEESTNKTPEQYAFDRINSFISGGLASEIDEDLRQWFDPNHPKGGWKRINSKGEAIGPCAREPGEPKPKCMSNETRAELSKSERAAAVATKRRHDSNPERKGKPINVSSFGKGKISEMTEFNEENKPTNPSLWSKAKSLARQKFDVYPSAYANGWAAKWYKSKGGGWKTANEEVQYDEAANPAQQAAIAIAMKKAGKKPKNEEVTNEDCWDGYKRVGMKKKGGKMVPNCVPEQTAEKQSTNKNDPSSRFDATTSLVNIYSKDTPGEKMNESRLDIIKRVVLESQVCADCDCGLAEEVLNERGADSKGYFRSTESGAGLTAKGAAHFRRQNPGSKLSTAVTEKNPKGRRAARRRSFCARMSGMKGPMKDEKGRPTRKAMSLRRWRC